MKPLFLLFWHARHEWAVAVVLLGVAIAGRAQQKVIPLWPGAAPGSENWTWHERTLTAPKSHRQIVVNVVRPTLTVYAPEKSKANGTAIIVAPGGGFHFLAIDYEGTEVAHWLAARGVTAFLLKYRLLHTTGATAEAVHRQTAEDTNNHFKMEELMKPLTPLVLADGDQAVRVVREHASEWNVRQDRIGIIGFSAGGYVSAAVALRHDAASRPDFAAAIYPALPGRAMVPPDASPMFIACASDDPLLPPLANCVRLYTLWEIAGVPVELHVYAKGGHGFGMTKRGLPVDHWIDAFGRWLGSQGLLSPGQF